MRAKQGCRHFIMDIKFSPAFQKYVRCHHLQGFTNEQIPYSVMWIMRMRNIMLNYSSLVTHLENILLHPRYCGLQTFPKHSIHHYNMVITRVWFQQSRVKWSITYHHFLLMISIVTPYKFEWFSMIITVSQFFSKYTIQIIVI